MATLLRLSSVLPLLLAGCAVSTTPGDPSNRAASAVLTNACPLHVRPILADESIAESDLIGPTDVAAIHPATPLYEGELSTVVDLLPAADRKLRAYSASHIGGSLSFSCGGKPLSRAVITAPFGSGFRMHVGDRKGT